MTEKELLLSIKNQISAEEWQNISENKIYASQHNYAILAEIKNAEAAGDKGIDESEVKRVAAILEDYLKKYMADNPDAWKWIILPSIYLTYVTGRPMHPIERTGIEVEDGPDGTIYRCPLKTDEEGIACQFCVCKTKEAH